MLCPQALLPVSFIHSFLPLPPPSARNPLGGVGWGDTASLRMMRGKAGKRKHPTSWLRKAGHLFLQGRVRSLPFECQPPVGELVNPKRSQGGGPLCSRSQRTRGCGPGHLLCPEPRQGVTQPALDKSSRVWPGSSTALPARQSPTHLWLSKPGTSGVTWEPHYRWELSGPTLGSQNQRPAYTARASVLRTWADQIVLLTVTILK